MSGSKLTVELHADTASASFNVDGRQVTLDEKNRTFNASSEAQYRDLLRLPFLKAADKGGR